MDFETAAGSSNFSSLSWGQNSEDRIMAERGTGGCSSSGRRASSSWTFVLIRRESATSYSPRKTTRSGLDDSGLLYTVVSTSDFHLILKCCASSIFGAKSVLYWDIRSINQHTRQEQGDHGHYWTQRLLELGFYVVNTHSGVIRRVNCICTVTLNKYHHSLYKHISDAEQTVVQVMYIFF